MDPSPHLKKSSVALSIYFERFLGHLERLVCTFIFDNFKWMPPCITCVSLCQSVLSVSGNCAPQAFCISIGENTALLERESCGTWSKELPASRQSVLNSTSEYTATYVL